jgi:hypothetical protein
VKGFENERGVKLGYAEPLAGTVETLDMRGSAKGPHDIVAAAEGFQAVEHRLAVVQHGGGRIQDEWLVRDDTGIVPAAPLGVVQDEHVVGEDIAELQLVVGRPPLQRLGARHGNWRRARIRFIPVVAC